MTKNATQFITPVTFETLTGHKCIREDMQTAANRMKAITTIQNAVADCEKHKAVHDKYIKIGWKIRKEAYAEKLF